MSSPSSTREGEEKKNESFSMTSSESPTHRHSSSSANAIQAVQNVLKELDIDYDESGPDSGIFRFDLDYASIAVIVRNQQLILYAFDGSAAPIIAFNVRSKISEFVCRTNFAMNYGNFEFNMDQGKLRYKLSIPSFDVKDVPVILKHFLSLAEQTYPKYAHGITLILNEGMSPKEAVQICKKNSTNTGSDNSAPSSSSSSGIMPDSLLINGAPGSPDNSARSPRKMRSLAVNPSSS